MFSHEFIDVHHRRCDESDADPETLGKIEEAIDVLKAAGVRKIAFDVEGVLASDYIGKAVVQLRRPTANAVLAMVADRMPEKPIIWSSATYDHLREVLYFAQIENPKGVEVIDAWRFIDHVPSPLQLMREDDTAAFVSHRLFNFSDLFRTDAGKILERCRFIVDTFGKQRILEYCQMPSDTDLKDLLHASESTVLDDHNLRDTKKLHANVDLARYLEINISHYTGKFPQQLGVDLLLDDRSGMHRMLNVLLGHHEGAKAIRHVPRLKIFPPTVEASLTYCHGDKTTRNTDDYFDNDTGLIDALRAGPVTHPLSK